MEEKNKKILYSAVAILVIFMIICISILYMKKPENKTTNEQNTIDKQETTDTQLSKIFDYDNTKEIKEELKNVELFAIKDDDNVKKLIAVDNSGVEFVIYDFSKYDGRVVSVNYFYDNNRNSIYLAIKSDMKNLPNEHDIKFDIGVIDISSEVNEYKLQILKDNIKNKYNYVSLFDGPIAKLSNYIYFEESGTLYKMSLEDYKITETNVNNPKHNIDVNSYLDKYLIYNNDGAIYMYDKDNDSKDVILENAYIELIYKDELFYGKGLEEGKYAFNLNTKEIKKISEPINMGTLGFNYVIPYNNSYLSYIDGTFHYDNNKEFKLTCNNLHDNDCISVAADSYIRYGHNLIVVAMTNIGYEYGDAEKVFLVNIDLNNQKINSIEERSKYMMYRYITYVN